MLEKLNSYILKVPNQVDANSDNVLSRQEFHDMMNRNRLRHPFKRGELAFEELDKNKVGGK